MKGKSTHIAVFGLLASLLFVNPATAQADNLKELFSTTYEQKRFGATDKEDSGSSRQKAISSNSIIGKKATILTEFVNENLSLSSCTSETDGMVRSTNGSALTYCKSGSWKTIKLPDSGSSGVVTGKTCSSGGKTYQSGESFIKNSHSCGSFCTKKYLCVDGKITTIYDGCNTWCPG